MKSQKKLATVMAATMVATSFVTVTSARETNNATIIGKNRIETAVKISKDGWNSAETVVLVNDSAIADALTATPLAFAKNAPILLTSKKGLSKETKDEIKRLGAKDIILIGGKTVLPEKIESELKSLGLKPDRISGNTREETALAIAKRLDGIKDVSEVAVVNGTTGLADAVSVAAAAAERNMPILLANPKKGLTVSEKFIKDEALKASFVIGGKTVLPEKLVSILPTKQRIEGSTRNDTNAKVIEKFYADRNLDNLYLAKDGRGGDSQLIDALAVGVLAVKNGAPVLIASKNLNEKQIEVINTKRVDTITQVGGNGNEKAFSQLKDIEKEVIYEVNSMDELDEVLKKSNANDIIVVKPSTTVSNDVNVSTNKAVEIELQGNYSGTVMVNTPNADIVNKGNVSELEVKNAENTTITNSSSGKITDLVVDSSSENVSIKNNGTITQIENNAEDTTIKNDGTISKPITGSEDATVDGNKPGNGGSSSGGGSIVTPDVSSVTASVYRNDINVSAFISYAGSNKATVELIDKDGNSVKKENVDVTNGKLEYKFESIEKGEYTVKVTVGGSSKVSEKVKVENSIYEVNNESELKAALVNANPGDTIKLSNNIKELILLNQINIDKSITLDLNNKILKETTGEDKNIININESNIVIEIRNGIICNESKRSNAKHSGIFIDKGNDNIKLNLNQIDINMSGYDNKVNYNCIYPNGYCKEIYITLNKCNLKGADMGIYYPVVSGNLIINDSTIDETKVAVGIKGGITEINDSTLIGYGAKGYDIEGIDKSLADIHPSDGIITCGDALAVECNYSRGIDVTVNNSYLESKYAYGVRMQFFKGNFERNLTINGGTVKGACGSIYNKHNQHNDTNYETYKTVDPVEFKKGLKLNSVNLEPAFSFEDDSIK